MFSCPLIRNAGRIYYGMLKYERYLFALFLAISLLQLWLTRYVPSLDGPQHLYNANVLVELLKGNDLFCTFFSVNEVVVGYWTGHFFLTFFHLLFPAWLAEKLFLSAYVLGMVFSFRYLVRTINPAKGNFVTFLIFPFVYHSYLLLGYYSFSIAAIFFFLAIGYWIRYYKDFTWIRVLVFALLNLGIFLSHGLVFVLYGITFVILFASTFLHDGITGMKEQRLAKWFVTGLKSAVAVLPALILWVIYIRSVMSINNAVVEPSFSFTELVKFLMRIRQLVGFHHEMEAIGYIPVFILTVILALTFLVLFLQNMKYGTARFSDLLDKRNAWIFVSLAFLGLYFFAPDRISAGSLTHRFGLFFWLALITWLAVQKFPKVFHILTLVVLLFSVSYTRYIHQRFYQNLNRDISNLEKLATMMKPNSTVHSLNASNNWVHIHFPLYAASDGPFVHLRNPQCQGQFPVVWNNEALPACYAGEKKVVLPGSKGGGDSGTIMKIDYITVFGYEQFVNDSTNAEWFAILNSSYEQVYITENGKAALYEKR
jgi:hypothetical protein